jgi:trehalose 2-sulfotransferase
MSGVDAPARSYLVCATPRSGSTLLCELLRSTGVAGHPEEYFEALRATGRPRQPREYFDGLDDPVTDHLPPRDPGEPESPDGSRRLVADALACGTTPNGVFGAKVMWGYFADFVARVRSAPGCDVPDAATAIDALLPGVRYVRVVRDDKVAQAVSLWRALQTQQWRDDGAGAAREHRAEYSFAAIEHLVEQLVAHEAAWQAWFDSAGVTPVDVAYERVAATPAWAVAQVLGALGVEGSGDHPPDVPMRRQSDERSDEWIRWFHRERVAA